MSLCLRVKMLLRARMVAKSLCNSVMKTLQFNYRKDQRKRILEGTIGGGGKKQKNEKVEEEVETEEVKP